MAFKKRKTTTRKKRPFKARIYRTPKPKATKANNMVVLGKGFPKRVIATHKYSEVFQLTSTIGSATTHHWRANGMFDPDASFGGHQPMFYDQFTPIYGHYVIIGSKITARVMQATATGVPMTVGLFLNDDATLAFSTMSTFKEQNSTTYRQIAAADNNIHTLSCKYSAKKTYGGAVASNPNLWGIATADPAEDVYFTFLTQVTDGSSTNSIVLDIMIEYIALWSGLNDVSGS